MKRALIFLGAVLALAASYAWAGEHPAKFSSTEYGDDNGKIGELKLSNASLISACTSEAGASLQYLAEAGATDDFLVVVNPCGEVICTNSVIHLTSDDWVSVTNGAVVTEIASLRFDILAGGGGYMLFDVTKQATSTGTNLSIKAAGVYDTPSTNPATFTLTVTGDFKPGKTCP